MKSETATVTVTHTRGPKSSAAWKATLILIPIVTAGLLFWLRQAQVQHLTNRTISSYGALPSFEFVNQDAQPFGSAQLAGRIWIADFIFTSCPGPCPIISSRMSELQKPLAKTDIHLVSFTVDPEKDTPEVLRVYAEKLHAQSKRWDFLTGSRAAIDALTRDGFKLAVSDGSDEGGMPVHSTRVVLVDRRGAIRGYYDALAPDAVTKLLADANHLFREQPK
jgi:protein SCO1/2